MTSLLLRLLRPLRRSFWTRIRIVLSSRGHGAFRGDYAAWLESKSKLTQDDLHYMQTATATWPLQPRVLVFADPALKPAELDALEQNLRSQVYPNWKLLTAAPDQVVTELGSHELEARDLVLIAAPGVVFSRRSLFCFAAAFARRHGPLVVFGDEDRIDPEGLRTSPFFKPGWSPESFADVDYITSSCAVSAEWLAGQEPGTLVRDALLALSRQEGAPPAHHIPQTLVSLPLGTEPTIRKPAQGSGAEPGSPCPSVAILIPTRDRPDDLRTCVKSLVEHTDYPNYTVHIIDNGSVLPETKTLLSELAALENVEVTRDTQPFNFSAINNLAAKQMTSKVLCFLNDDTRIHKGDWLTELVNYAARDEIGAVGPMLLYPNGTIQHAGVFIGTGPLGLAGHLHREQDPEAPELQGYVDRVQNVSAVTGACLVIRRTVFDQVGGFDEDLSVCYNDVDLCLRIETVGLRNVWTPYSVLYHNENVSAVVKRSEADESRYWHEAGLFERRWRSRLKCDSGFHPNLALLGEQLRLAERPRTSLRAATRF
ncbi:MAG: glycosyltransferase family 2 protein [Planctomycetota bacterium]|nr:glycosyltransferase family 2 protein [Planctomycetota bacterium]